MVRARNGQNSGMPSRLTAKQGSSAATLPHSVPNPAFPNDGE